jgi:hypothetical protein
MTGKQRSTTPGLGRVPRRVGDPAAERRGETIHQEYAGLGLDLRRLRLRLRLRDIATARRGDLPDLDVFLLAWIDALLDEDGGLTPELRRTWTGSTRSTRPAGSSRPQTPLSLTTLLTRRLTQDTASDQQRQRWLAAAEGVVEQRVAAVVTSKHRPAYAKAAALVVAYAETLALTGASTGCRA